MAPQSAASAQGPGPAPRSSSSPAALLETMRPKQWVKNLFVFAGIAFSGELFNLASERAAWTTFVAFCLASGATYLFNDACDAKSDRLSPRTASRPIARGALSRDAAFTAAAVTMVAALALTATVNWSTLAALAAFVLLQVAYSTSLKRVLFVDVLAISAGFVLRAYAGLVAVDVAISPWILLCTGLLALFLGLGKRRGESLALAGPSNPQRPVLDSYSTELIDELIAVVTPGILIAYALYAVLGARSELMLLTVPFVIYGLFRTLYLMRADNTMAEDPTSLVYRDRPLLLCIALWAIAAAVISVTAG